MQASRNNVRMRPPEYDKGMTKSLDSTIGVHTRYHREQSRKEADFGRTFYANGKQHGERHRWQMTPERLAGMMRIIPNSGVVST